jgi:hypothetical protein
MLKGNCGEKVKGAKKRTENKSLIGNRTMALPLLTFSNKPLGSFSNQQEI